MATLAGRNLPAKARARGLRVIEMPGWEGRGEGGSFSVLGILLHHDAMGLGYVNSKLSDNMNVPNNMAQDGADGSQLWIGLDTSGQMVLVFMASGLKWHAGSGSGFRSIRSGAGNSTTVGIETDHTIGTGWSAELVYYIDVTTRLLVDEFGIDPQQWLAGHREYAPARKIDPEAFDLDAWRSRAGRPFSGAVAHTGEPAKPAPAKPQTWKDPDMAQAIIADGTVYLYALGTFRAIGTAAQAQGQLNEGVAYGSLLSAKPREVSWDEADRIRAWATRPQTAIQPKKKPAPVTPAAKTATVQKGNTLSAIAAAHGTTWEVLAKLNNLANPNDIQPGQVLKLPN